MEIENIIHPSGTIIAGRYVVVVGPREQKHLMGGMGLVYLCEDKKIADYPVALKTFQPQFLPDREARDGFLREGNLWLKLGQHPFLVQAYGVAHMGDDGREIYLILQYIAPGEGKPGASLRHWLFPGQARIPSGQSLRWMWEVAQGLAYAAQRQPGFVHRDLKPENILIGRDNHARVTDLGLACCFKTDTFSPGEPRPSRRFLEAEPQDLKRTHFTQYAVGTPLYMAPEQWKGHKNLDVRTDIYAWGCLVLELLTGQWPVSGKTKEELAEKHLTGQVEQNAQRLSSGVRELVVRCVAVDRTNRYTTWMDMLTDMERGYPGWTHTLLPSVPPNQADTKFKRVTNGWSLNALGVSYLHISMPGKAIEFFQKVQAIGEAEKDQVLQGASVGNLGNAYMALGDPQRALRFYEQHLTIARVIGDRAGEGAALGHLGIVYSELGDPQRALTLHEQDLAIARTIGDRAGESRASSNLGNAYRALGDPQRALRFYEQDLEITRALGDRAGEGRALGNLGIAYRDLGDPQRALSFHEQRLAIARAIGDQAGEGRALGNLGIIYVDLGDPQRALAFHQQHLEITRALGDRAGEGRTLGNLGIAYTALGDSQRAIMFHEQHLAIARALGDRAGVRRALGNLSNAYRTLGLPQRAITFDVQHLAIAQAMGDQAGVRRVLFHLGEGHRKLGDPQGALTFYEQDLKIACDIRDRLGEAIAHFNLALCCREIQDVEQVRFHAEAALEGFTQMGYPTHAQKAQQLLEELPG